MNNLLKFIHFFSLTYPYDEILRSQAALRWKILTLLFSFDNAVDEAMCHPYLASLHAINDEPVCPAPFSFDFEQPSLTEEDIKEIIWKESLKFNPDPIHWIFLHARSKPGKHIYDLSTPREKARGNQQDGCTSATPSSSGLWLVDDNNFPSKTLDNVKQAWSIICSGAKWAYLQLVRLYLSPSVYV